jgi:hypothetical protein
LEHLLELYALVKSDWISLKEAMDANHDELEAKVRGIRSAAS